MQVTIRDLTVRAADCPDMASLFFFFLHRRPGVGGQSRNWMCLLETGEAQHGLVFNFAVFTQGSSAFENRSVTVK